ncbi:MAG: ABC transporter permease [Chloroflexi bacterium]|nr:ABC transporter permease [Chloroflexota bacterium]
MMEATTTKPSGMATAAKSLVTAWDLLVAVTLRDLKVRYQGTVLSYIWWIARPLALGMVLYFALGRVLRLDVEGSDTYVANYGVFLLAGLFPWFWFSGAVQQSASAIVANGGLLKKVRFPRLILPLSAVFFNTVQFLLTLPILIIFVLFAGIDPDITWAVGIPLLLGLQLLMLMGLGMLVAALNVFFRDLGPLIEVVLLLMFYTSGVIFPLERVPERFQPIVKLSPMTTLLEAWRDLFLRGSLPGLDLWPAVAGTVVVVVIGVTTFRTLERFFADAL